MNKEFQKAKKKGKYDRNEFNVELVFKTQIPSTET